MCWTYSPATPFAIWVEQDEVRIKKIGSIKDIKGMIEYDGPPVSIDDMNDAILEYATRKA